MALMDAYGLGPNPVRLIVLLDLANWVVCSVFTIQPSIVLLAIGCFLWMLSIPVIEAAEQTVLQRAIPWNARAGSSGSPSWSRTPLRR